MLRSVESLRLRRIAAAWPLAALGLVLAVAPPKTAPTPVDAVAESGMRIAIDPETGDPIGSPAGGAALETTLSRSSAGLVPYRLPDGGTGVHLQGRFMSASMVRLNADGELETICTEDHDHAVHFLQDTDEETVEWEVQ